MRIGFGRFGVAAVGVALAMSLLLLWLALPAKAQASGSTIRVNTAKDELNENGKCSLREAIANANDDARTSPGCGAGSGEDTIVFALGKSAIIRLNPELGQLDVTDDEGLTIDGGSANITVSGVNEVRVFQVNPLAELTLKKLTVANADVGFDFGGGVFNNGGTLEVVRSTFTGNTAGFGGGIYTQGTAVVTDSTFSRNSAEDDGVASGFGGGLDNRGTVEISGSTFNANTADQNGGGLRNGDVAAGVTDSEAGVTNSTFFENSATNGGGTANNGVLEVTNATFSKNNAELLGGGVESAEGVATLRNTILAYNRRGDNCAGTAVNIVDDGYNISSDDSCPFVAEGSRNNTDPRLAGQLASNGGPTRTISLFKDSPAIGAIPRGTNGCGDEVQTDQRGVKRPQGRGCDVGSFEKVNSSR